MATYLHSIYGGGTNYFTLPSILPADTCCTDALLALSSLFSALENAVTVFFPSSSIVAPMIAAMGATVKVSDKVFVRLTWAQQYPGIVFQSDCCLHLLQIKDLYLQFGMDYTNDPLFKSGLGLTLL